MKIMYAVNANYERFGKLLEVETKKKIKNPAETTDLVSLNIYT